MEGRDGLADDFDYTAHVTPEHVGKVFLGHHGVLALAYLCIDRIDAGRDNFDQNFIVTGGRSLDVVNRHNLRAAKAMNAHGLHRNLLSLKERLTLSAFQSSTCPLPEKSSIGRNFMPPAR
jgi:hypothetical protein